MNKPLISIIIPTYNSEQYLRECVNSALKQDYGNVEIILVNDGSTDNTIGLFSEFQELGVRCYSIRNVGASGARNFGLEKSRGDYIQFLDADDIIDATKISKQLELMQELEADISYSFWINFNTTIYDNQTEFRFNRLDHMQKKSGKDLMVSFGMENWFVPTIAWLVKRELIKKAGFWNPAKCPNDDGEFFSRVLFWSQNVVCCNSILSFHRVLPNSLSRLTSVAKINASFKSYCQIESLLDTCESKILLSYPKRLYFKQYALIKNRHPKLAKRAAKHFDNIEAPVFLINDFYYWKLINYFGLYRGTKIYKILKPIWSIFTKSKSLFRKSN